MNLIEFIGFIISLAAVTFLFIKKMLEDRQRRRNPEEYAKREALQAENLRRFLKSAGLNHEEDNRKNREIGEEEDDEEEIERAPIRKSKGNERFPPQSPPPRPTYQPPQYAQPSYQPPQYSSASYQPPQYSQPSYALKPTDHYEVIRSDVSSTAGKTIKNLKSPREMLIIKEIFDKPLSMRDR